MKYTPGPLTVRVSDKWPHDIETINSAGEVVFSRGLPCHSTHQKNAQEAMAGAGLPADWKAAERNSQALADEVLRASAPDLLAVLQKIHAHGYTTTDDHAMVVAAIAKASPP